MPPNDDNNILGGEDEAPPEETGTREGNPFLAVSEAYSALTAPSTFITDVGVAAVQSVWSSDVDFIPTVYGNITENIDNITKARQQLFSINLMALLQI